MKRERRKPTRRELEAATSRRPVVRRIAAPLSQRHAAHILTRTREGAA